jgi:tetratricopeptide (TPR) repeat protein
VKGKPFRGFESPSLRQLFFPVSRLKSSTLLLVVAGAVVLGVYGASARLGTAVFGNDDPKEAVYNRMIEGFSDGHLYLRREVPAGFAALPDPYDPAQNAAYRTPPDSLYDLSYYRGKLYAYFGPAPALLAFWPYHLATGRYLSNKASAVAFCSAGFLALAWLLCDIRRRYAPALPAWTAAVMLVAVGLSTGLPTLLTRIDVWEVPIACALALLSAFLACLWQAWHRPKQRNPWLAFASMVLGLAIAARPTVVLAIPVLLLFLLATRKDGTRESRLKGVACAALPLLGCGLGLALYNLARFGRLAEFGQSYVLIDRPHSDQLHLFGLAYVWDNLRIYFLHPASWQPAFPFVGEARPLALTAGYPNPEFNFGLLIDVPLAWLALGALSAGQRNDGLGFLTRAVTWLAAAQTGVLLLLAGATSRYEAELLGPIILLAALALLAPGAGRIRPAAFRYVWVALAACSILFNVGHAAAHAVKFRIDAGEWMIGHRDPQAALPHFDTLLLLEPDNAVFHNQRGFALAQLGRIIEAQGEFEATVRLDPASAQGHCNLGLALLAENHPAAAAAQFEETLRLAPNNAGARAGLGFARQALDGIPPPASR